MEIHKDFSQLLSGFELLNRNDVRYLIVGGYAYAVHAEPRYTKDVDVFYKRNKSNAEKLIYSLNAFGFESLDLITEDFTKPGRIIQIGNPPLRIDLINEIDGISFREAWNNKIESMYGNQPIYVISKQDLIKNKKASGRDQDLVDVQNLEKY